MAAENRTSRPHFRTSHISSVISVSLVLFMMGLLGIFVFEGQKISTYVKENIQLTIFMKDNVSDPEIEIITRLLKNSPYVKSAEFISADEAAKRLQKDLGEDFMDFIGYNPLSASIDVKLKSEYANTDSLAKFEKIILENKMVREVVYQKPLLETVNKNIRAVSLLILGFSGLLLLISIALINNTIRLMVYSDRFLIRSMQLVGATRGFIIKPFLLKGLFQGLWAGIVACLMLGSLLYLGYNKIEGLSQTIDKSVLYYLFPAVITCGILFTVLSTFFSVRRFLRLKSELIYL
jgi:cell division transport system permease protein